MDPSFAHENEAAFEPTVRPMLRAEYDVLVEQGSYDRERVELIRGEVLRMSPQGSEHSYVVRELGRRLTLALGERAVVQVQGPVAASPISEPEPDLCVLPHDAHRRDAHPERAVLVIEVSASSLRFDRETKTSIYAEMGVPEYWIVNLRDRWIEVHTDPVGERYGSVRTVSAVETLGVAAFPDVSIRIADLLSRQTS